jgi:hypothetical protein
LNDRWTVVTRRTTTIPARDWPWPWEGYTSVRLSVGDDIMLPIQDQIVAHVAAVVKAANTVHGLEEGVRKFRNPYLPPFIVEVVADKNRQGPDQERVDIAVRAGRR